MRAPSRSKKSSLTEFQKHTGWIQNLKSENRNMKESLIKCIEHGYTNDPERAKKILKDQFEEIEETPEVSVKENFTWEPNSTKGLLEFHK